MQTLTTPVATVMRYGESISALRNKTNEISVALQKARRRNNARLEVGGRVVEDEVDTGPICIVRRQ